MNETSDASQRPPRPRRFLPSIRLLVAMIVVVPAALVAVSLVTIATVTSRGIAEQLGQEIVDGATSRVSSDVRDYLGSAVRLSDLYVRRMHDDFLKPDDLKAWEQIMFRDLGANPGVASICFSTTNADCTWLLYAHGRLELGLVDGRRRDQAVEYPATADGYVDRRKPIRVYHYDATIRPWYQLAIKSDAAVWTPAYFWFGEQGQDSETGIGYTRPVRDDAGNLLGVLVIDVTLSALSQHLKQLPIATNGYAFIVDDQGKLIAASDGAVNSAKGERLSPEDSASPAGRAIASLMKSPATTSPTRGTWDQLDPPQTHRVMVNNEPVRVQVTDLRPYPGIHWHVVTLLPESTFLSSAASLERRAVVLALGTIVGGLGLALVMARYLSDPLIRLTNHVARVGAGDFDSRLDLAHAAELRRLSDQVNTMAGGLKRRMSLEHSIRVAEQVQQRLLPAAPPNAPGLDIAGMSQYCEATGGDYFDFIDYCHPADPAGTARRTLLAVGDVVGHGVGAALLMATARGALRAGCDSADSLAHLMREMNLVLCHSVRDGMFMTMTLVLVEPETGNVRWCNAGHDPTIIYHPETGAFDELSDYGGAPLGIDADMEYEELTRCCAKPGSLILIGTDGIWEARSPAGEMYGKDRLRDILRGTTPDTTAAEVVSQLRTSLEVWMGGLAAKDDITLIAVRVKSLQPSSPIEPAKAFALH